MAITIKEIYVRTTIVPESKRSDLLSPELFQALKEEIIRELREDESNTYIKRRRRER